MNKMLNKKTILEGLLKLKVDSSIEISQQELEIKVNIIHEQCQDLIDEDFVRATNQIIKQGTELYGKLPKASLFLDKAGKKELSPEQLAHNEAWRVLKHTSGYFPRSPVVFDNATTMAMIVRYGGIGKIAWDVDSSNDYQKSTSNLSKELISIWLDCYHSGEKSYIANRPTNSSGDTLVIGNDSKWQAIEKEGSMFLEAKQTRKVPVPDLRVVY